METCEIGRTEKRKRRLRPNDDEKKANDMSGSRIGCQTLGKKKASKAINWTNEEL